MKKDMLEQLANFLDELPETRFNYNHWVGGDWQGEQDLSCGTAACAGGWAVTLWPEQLLFKDYGIFLKADFSKQNLCALAAVFGIDEKEAHVLFLPRRYSAELKIQSPDGDAGPKEVAAHIRRFISVREREQA